MILQLLSKMRPETRKSSRRFLSYMWAVLLASTIVVSYATGEPGVVGSPVRGGDVWPPEVWIGIGAVTIMFCLAAALTPERLFVRWRRYIEAPALALVAGLAVARIGFLLDSSAAFGTKPLPIALWGGPLVLVFLHLSVMGDE
mgnify:CR=1 FL=1